MGIMISIGKYDGFYFKRGWSWRIGLGWFAVTILPVDGDVILEMSANAKWSPSKRVQQTSIPSKTKSISKRG